MKTSFSLHKLLRLSALLLAPLLSLYDFCTCGALSPAVLSVNLWCALQLLVLYPVPHERIGPSMAACGVSLAITVALKLLAAPPWAFALGGTALAFLFSLHRGVCRFADVPPLFMVSTVWEGVLDYLCLMHMCAFMFLGVWLSVPALLPFASWALLASVLALFGMQYYRIMTRSTLFLGRRKETLIRQGQRGSGYKLPVQYVDSESRSAVLFNDVVKIMEVKKPYLQDDFGLDDLSRLTRTNRLYLSKAIKILCYFLIVCVIIYIKLKSNDYLSMT